MGDLFNYDAPGDDSNNSEGPEGAIQISSPQPISTTNHEIRNNAEAAGLVVETQSERLTDGGFEEDANAYCLYARRNYQLGEQVQVLN